MAFFPSLFLAVFPIVVQCLDNGLGLTPPMGWNSWNCIGGNVNEAYVKEIGDGLVTSGLAAKGYTYVNLDDGVMLANRTADGKLQPDPAKFSNGSLRPLADYLHSLGLKFGIYTCGGTKTCMGRAGSYNHEESDAAQFAEWGVDYLKMDWCNSQDTAKHRYPIMRDALNKTSRPIFFKMCEWGNENVWEWGAGVANSWRTYNDICNYWFTNHTENPYCSGVYDVIEANEPHWSYAGPGGWNDPCYLVVGNQYVSKGGNFTMNYIQQQTQMSIWALMASPLILSSDVRSASPEQLRILGNEQVIAINQDPLGTQGHVVSHAGPDNVVRIWRKPLHNGSVAVGVYNYANVSVAMLSVPWSAVGLSEFVDYHNVWTNSDTEHATALEVARLEAHETLLIVCSNNTVTMTI